jgi:hypothetical protein
MGNKWQPSNQYYSLLQIKEKKLDLRNNQKMGPRKPMVSKVAETAPHIVLTRVLSSRGDQWSVLIDRMSPP